MAIIFSKHGRLPPFGMEAALAGAGSLGRDRVHALFRGTHNIRPAKDLRDLQSARRVY